MLSTIAASTRFARPIVSRLATAAHQSKKTKFPFHFSSVSNTGSKMTLTTLPSVSVLQGFPDPQSINLSDYCAGKNILLIGLPGAFTPTWSATQVPGYLEKQEELKAAGIEEVIFYCVNDPAVMQAWGKDQKIENSIVTFFADPSATLTKALDMEMTHPGPPSVGIIGRCKRFAIHADDEEIKAVVVSEGPDDPAGDDDPSQTLVDNMLEVVKKNSSA